jgi:hypothetical protein
MQAAGWPWKPEELTLPFAYGSSYVVMFDGSIHSAGHIDKTKVKIVGSPLKAEDLTLPSAYDKRYIVTDDGAIYEDEGIYEGDASLSKAVVPF